MTDKNKKLAAELDFAKYIWSKVFPNEKFNDANFYECILENPILALKYCFEYCDLINNLINFKHTNMEILEENLTSLDFLLTNLSGIIYIPMNKLKETNNIIKKAKEKHDKELNDAYLMGLEYGDKYKNKEKFPF